MTLFAVACAGIFPLLHLGRPWASYCCSLTRIPWGCGRNFAARWSGLLRGLHLCHRLAAVLVRGPDTRLGDACATARSRVGQLVYGILSTGLAWFRELTGNATSAPTGCWPRSPRRWSSRCIASCQLDFARGSCLAGIRTIFPPYFVAGAIFSGFAMVLTLAIPLRKSTGWRISSRRGIWRRWRRSSGTGLVSRTAISRRL